MQFEKLLANQKHAAEMLSVMGSPARLALLFCLMEGELSVGELVEKTGISRASLSQHMTILRLLKFVRSRRDGHFIHYRLISEPAISVLRILEQLYFTGK